MLLKHTKKGLIRIKGLQVINDCTEGGVALISQYNEILTENEEQRQYLLNVFSNTEKNSHQLRNNCLFK